MTHISHLIIAILMVVSPISVAAYSSPDVYLYEDNYGLPPATARHAYDRVQAQNDLYNKRREAQNGRRGTSSSTAGVLIPAPAAVSKSIPVSNVNSIENVDDSLVKTINKLTWSVESLDQTVMDFRADMLSVSRQTNNHNIGTENMWHGGAPLQTYSTSVPTLPYSGPQIWVFGSLLLAAGIWTFSRASLREGF